MKNKLLTYAPIIISILSLLVSIFMARIQFTENIEVVNGEITITSVNIDDKIMECKVDIIVANTAYSTTSLLNTKVYKNYVGFRSSEQIVIQTDPDMPITLTQGSAAKISVKCRYPLEEEEILEFSNCGDIIVALNSRSLSIRLYSAKDKTYYTNAYFDRAKVS